MAAPRILAAAAASGKTAYVFFVDGRLKQWGMSRKASKSAGHASSVMKQWIDQLRPDVVITEDIQYADKKSEKTKSIIDAMACTADKEPTVNSLRITRQQHYQNKYDEAEALAQAYPILKAWVPKPRRFFDNEPRNTVLFEALALADYIFEGPATNLAAAMG